MYDGRMDNGLGSKAKRIDVEFWERRALYELFSSYSEPFHGVCLRVDCTETYRFAKDSGISVFLALLHRSLIAAHRVDNLMLRIVDGEVWKYSTIHGGSPVGRPNGTIGFGHYIYQPEVGAFAREAQREIERVRSRSDLERHEGQGLIRYSVLPWFDFTSISHARDYATPDSAPKITFGKITESGGKFTMPVSIHVHHALADGLHVAHFVEHWTQYLKYPDSI